MRGSAEHRAYGELGERHAVSDVLQHEVARRVARRRDLVCAGCGYGVVVTDEPDRCPICSGTDWDFAPWRPFSGGASTFVA